MSAIITCLDETALERLVSGGVPTPDLVGVYEHLRKCPSCARAYFAKALAALIAASSDELKTPLHADTNPAESGVADGPALEEAPAVEVLTSTPTLCQSAPRAAAEAHRSDSRPRARSRARSDLARLKEMLEPPPAADELGRLGRYRVLRLLGAGGMGLVVEADDLNQPGRRVALKLIKAGPDASESLRQRFFLREAKAMAGLKSDYLVPILDYGEENGVPFIAMPLLHGETLAERLEREPRPPLALVLQVGREVTAGLEAARLAGWVHRDVKPGNIFLEAHGDGCRAILLDFGVAAVSPDEPPLPARTGELATPSWVVVGTPGYVSPEAAAFGPITHQSDLFSLGCVLYCLCTGRQTFRGSNPLELLWDVQNYDPRPPHELNPAVPRALSGLVMRLLAKRPKDRPARACDVLADLQAIEADLAGDAPRARERVRRKRVGDLMKAVRKAGSAKAGLVVVVPDAEGNERTVRIGGGEAEYDPATGRLRIFARAPRCGRGRRQGG
jgi:hypothetical protein